MLPCPNRASDTSIHGIFDHQVEQNHGTDALIRQQTRSFAGFRVDNRRAVNREIAGSNPAAPVRNPSSCMELEKSLGWVSESCITRPNEPRDETLPLAEASWERGRRLDDETVKWGQRQEVLAVSADEHGRSAHERYFYYQVVFCVCDVLALPARDIDRRDHPDIV